MKEKNVLKRYILAYIRIYACIIRKKTSYINNNEKKKRFFKLSMYVCMYVCMCVCVCVCMFMFLYIFICSVFRLLEHKASVKDIKRIKDIIYSREAPILANFNNYIN